MSDLVGLAGIVFLISVMRLVWIVGTKIKDMKDE